MPTPEQLDMQHTVRKEIEEISLLLRVSHWGREYSEMHAICEVAEEIEETSGWFNTKAGLKTIAERRLKRAKGDHDIIMAFVDEMPDGLEKRWDR